MLLYIPLADEDLEKGGYPVGTIRTRKGGVRYQKVTNKRWRELTKQGEQTGQPITMQHGNTSQAHKNRMTPGTVEYREKKWRPLNRPPRGFPPGDVWGTVPGKRGGTEQMHWDQEKNGYKTERKKLHEKVVASYFKGKTLPAEDAKHCIIAIGGIAAGKTTTLEKRGLGGPNYVHMDPDDIKTQLPEYEHARALKWEGSGAFGHEESSLLSKQVYRKAVDDGHDLIIDGSGKNLNKMIGYIKELKDHGYKVDLIMPDQDVEKGLGFAQKRAENDGRKAYEDLVRDAYDKVPKNFFTLARMVDSAALYDQRRNGTLVWEKDGEGETAHDPKFLSAYPNYRRTT